MIRPFDFAPFNSTLKVILVEAYVEIGTLNVYFLK